MSYVQNINRLHKLYTLVQQVSGELETIHQPRLHCKKGCFGCCVDNIEVFGIEAENIKKQYPEVLQQPPNAPGACAFLDREGACRIYDARPFVCRTHGLPLRTIAEENNKIFELRDICPLNEEGTPLENIDERQLFFTNPFEEALAKLQLECDGGKMERVGLRGMFIFRK
ncbi:MAG: YkgJ family cysteine cluster protein [Bacteroidota bacterium]